MSLLDNIFNADAVQVLAGDENLERNFLKLFTDNLQRGIEMMNTAANNNDAEAMRQAAHLLKGSTGIVKTDRMHFIASQTETAASTGNMEEAITLSHAFMLEFETFKTSASEK